MEIPALIPIINLDTVREPLEFVRSLLGAGLRFFQIRGKTIDDRNFLELSRQLVCAARTFTQTTQALVTVMINDRSDICLLAQADGVHLGADDIDPSSARQLLGNQALIGISTHSLEQLRAASLEPVDYIAFGPIFQSSKKSGHSPPLGLGSLKEARTISRHPLVAIGGITTACAKIVYESGAASIAVISDLENSGNIRDTVLAYEKASR